MEKDKHQYVEDFGLVFEQFGLGQTFGRVMGWLLICDPPYQTLDEICEALDMSKSTISTTVRSMDQFGMIKRVSMRGERRHYYQINDDFWINSFLNSMQQFSGFRKMAEQGLTLMQDKSPEQHHRLQKMYELYSFLEREFPAMLKKWEDEQQQLE